MHLTAVHTVSKASALYSTLLEAKRHKDTEFARMLMYRMLSIIPMSPQVLYVIPEGVLTTAIYRFFPAKHKTLAVKNFTGHTKAMTLVQRLLSVGYSVSYRIPDYINSVCIIDDITVTGTTIWKISLLFPGYPVCAVVWLKVA